MPVWIQLIVFSPLLLLAGVVMVAAILDRRHGRSDGSPAPHDPAGTSTSSAAGPSMQDPDSTASPAEADDPAGTPEPPDGG